MSFAASWARWTAPHSRLSRSTFCLALVGRALGAEEPLPGGVVSGAATRCSGVSARSRASASAARRRVGRLEIKVGPTTGRPEPVQLIDAALLCLQEAAGDLDLPG